MKQSTKDAIQRIKNAGFGYIKVELEGDIGRSNSGICSSCEDDGYDSCWSCDGEGAVDTGERVGIHGETVYAECGDCAGEGSMVCDVCDGSGMDTRFQSEEYCEDFLRENVSRDALSKLIFGRFYEDGSVDSEFTFTVAIEHSETILEWIGAFNRLAEECGGEIDVDGAGMHISVLPTECQGDYPVYRSHLDGEGLRNFDAQMEKLMPALYFLATPDWRSRPLEYRYPRVSSHDKFSAIYTHEDTCLEYRVFETCYDDPEKMYHNIEVIANTLEFYTNPELEATRLNRSFGFYEEGSIGHMFDTPDALRVLNKQLKYLKPKTVSMKQLKKERSVAETIKGITISHKKRIEALRADYERLVEVNRNVLAKPVTDRERAHIDEIMSWSDRSFNRALREVRQVPHIPSMREFINQNITNDTRYTVSV